MTVSSTCCATSAACCWADHVAGNSDRRDRIVTIAAAGSTTSVTRVSSGESHSMAATEVTTSVAVPSVNGTIDSSPCTSCRSVIARDATCPVRSASCRSPSSRATASKTRRRRSCWTSSDRRPAKYRRTNEAPYWTRASTTSAVTTGTSTAVEPATASSTTTRVSSGPTAPRPTPTTDDPSAAAVTPGWRRQAPVRRRIHPRRSCGGTGGLHPSTVGRSRRGRRAEAPTRAGECRLAPANVDYVTSRRSATVQASTAASAAHPASTDSAPHHGGGAVTPASCSTTWSARSGPASARAGKS